jgi:hypothetical protein
MAGIDTKRSSLEDLLRQAEARFGAFTHSPVPLTVCKHIKSRFGRPVKLMRLACS